jgi:ABC-type proline/glycine betaine transport system permease subunit
MVKRHVFVSYLFFMLAIVLGFMLCVSLFIAPYIAELIMDITDGHTKLPSYARLFFNLSQFMMIRRLFFVVIIGGLLGASAYLRFGFNTSNAHQLH